MGNEPPEALQANLQPAENNVFQEFDKHLLLVSEAAAALADRETCPKARATDAAPPRIREIAIPCPNQRWTSREPRKAFDLQYIVLATALLLALAFGCLAGRSLYGYFDQPDEVSGTTAVSALVERIIAVESNAIPTQRIAGPAQLDSLNFSIKPGLILSERIGRTWPEGAAQEKQRFATRAETCP